MPKKSTRRTPAENAKSKRKKVLGRGIDALIPDLDVFANPTVEYLQCDIRQIRANRYQPRRQFDADELQALCQSVQEQGVIQPLLVRKDDAGYELIAGERRLRAAKMAGLRRVPVIIKTITDRELLELSIIENIQRADLNAMEEADAYQRLIHDFELTQEQVAARIGKSRPAVANILRLRQLPQAVQSDIRKGGLSMGHARALLALKTAGQQISVWQRIKANRLSVRQTEALVKKLGAVPSGPSDPAVDSVHVYLQDVAQRLSRGLGTRVQIKRRGRRGRLEIEFYGDEDLDRLLALFTKIGL